MTLIHQIFGMEQRHLSRNKTCCRVHSHWPHTSNSH
jgi:hypothetical protein